jgi:Right handed beta helix region
MLTYVSQAVALSLSSLLLLASLGAAATYYIAPAASGGNDSNPCTEGAPCQTVNRAKGLMSACDTLYLRQGDYGNQSIVVAPGNNLSCSSGGFTVFASYPGETATLHGSGSACVLEAGGDPGSGVVHHIHFDRLDINGTNLGYGGCGLGVGNYQDYTTDIKFSNGEIRGLTGANSLNAIAGSGTRIEILNNRIHDVHTPGGCNQGNSDACYGMYIGVASSVIDGNEIYNNDGYGIHLYTEHLVGFVSNNIIRNNKIHNNGFAGGSGGSGSVIMTHGTNNQFYNNLVYNNAMGVQTGQSCSNAKIYQNTIYGNGGNGLDLNCQSGGTSEAKNNLLWNNSNNAPVVNSGSWITSPNFTNNPSFANAGGGDFSLTASSPAVNTVACIGGVASIVTDHAGVTRPQGSSCDYGALERVEGGPTPISGNPIHASAAASAQADCTIPETVGTPTSLAHALTCMSVPGKELRLTGTFDAVIDTLATPLAGGTSWPTATKVTSYGGGATLRLPNNTALEAILNLRGANDSYLIFENLTLDGLSRSFGDCILLQGPGHHIRFTNLVIQNCRNHALFSFGGQDIEVLGGTWTNSLAAPLIGTYQTNNWHVEGVTLCGSTSHGINMGEGFGTDNNVLINKVTLCTLTGTGIRIAGGSGNTIRNSLITGNGGLGLQLFSGSAGAKVHYNTIVSNTGMGVQCDAGVNTAAIRANIIVGNTAGQLVNTCGAAGGSNLVTGSLSAIFTNPASGDYSLAAGSPAQNSVLAGDDLSEVTDDIIGTARPQQVVRDAGAYESLLGPVQPPATPIANPAAALFFF